MRFGASALSITGAAVLAAGLTISPANASPSTVTVTVELSAHDGSALDLSSNPAGSASVYAGGWQSITAVDVNNTDFVQVQLTPGTYSFAVTYNGTRDQKTQTIGDSGGIVYFSTVLTRVALKAHDHNFLDIPGDGSASYYAGGWHAITALDPNNAKLVQTEMLPGTYSFAATYQGTREQKTATLLPRNPNNGANSVQSVNFGTELVRVALQAHDHSFLNIPADGSASYYAGGWHAITTPDPNNAELVQTEMLPGTYSFAATYQGTREQRNGITVNSPNPNLPAADNVQGVYFGTELVNVELQAEGLPDVADGTPLDIPANGSASYYAGGWHAISTPNPNNSRMVVAEMLPGTYSFAVTFGGDRQQQNGVTVNAPNPNLPAGDNVQTVYFHYLFM
jgi:hypothetical protein